MRLEHTCYIGLGSGTKDILDVLDVALPTRNQLTNKPLDMT